MASTNYEEELRKVLETLINFDAFTEKAKLDREKFPELEQSMNAYISLTKEIMHKARNGNNNCREYLIGCRQSLLRQTPGRKDLKNGTKEPIITQPDNENDNNSGLIDSGINSGIIAEESGEPEEKEVSRLMVLAEELNT